MKLNRSAKQLRLNRETIKILGTQDLSEVAGGSSYRGGTACGTRMPQVIVNYFVAANIWN